MCGEPIHEHPPGPVSPGVLVISLDFELYWGVRDVITMDACRDRLLGARLLVPELLQLFREYKIHATWATVGLLFLTGRDEAMRVSPEARPTYEDASMDPYVDLNRLGPDEEQDPFHWAPSLVRLVQETPGQELATHTFSHYYCLEDGQTLDQLNAQCLEYCLIHSKCS